MKPIVYNIKSFDASYEHEIPYSWSGNQQFFNTCTIRNNTTNEIVYQETHESLQLKHVIPEYSLTNGILYNLTIKVIDGNNIVSEESSPVLFYVFTTPSFFINNLAENQIVQNSSYQVSLTYSQAQGEDLQYFQLLLYNTNQNQIWTSGIKYDTSTLSATLIDLDDNGIYYIRATGQTINGMELDTGYTLFSVNYVMPSVYALVTLENITSEGSIKLQSNILSIGGKYSAGGTPTYIADNYVDLSNPNNNVYFEEGFSLDDNFTINIKGYDFSNFSTILQISNGAKIITLNKKVGTYLSEENVEKTYFSLQVPNSFGDYIINSNYITKPLDTDILSIWINRQDNVYDLFVSNITTS